MKEIKLWMRSNWTGMTTEWNHDEVEEVGVDTDGDFKVVLNDGTAIFVPRENIAAVRVAPPQPERS